MKLSRFLTGLAPALAIAALVGFGAPTSAQTPSPAATAEATPAPSPSAAASPAATPAATPAPAASPAAAAAATPAPAATPAGPPACAAAVAAVPASADGKTPAVAAVPAVLEKCTVNSGDTAWMLTSMALVLMMTIPGLGLFYGGMVRKKNVGDTVMTSFAITALVTVLFFVITYSLSFTSGNPYIGGMGRFFLRGMIDDITGSAPIGTANALAPTIPESVYMCFQMTFAIITPALIAGAFAERMKFSAMLWYIGLWAVFVYAPVAHWVWGPDGFLAAGNSDAKFHVLDFAGGTVVHINAGVSGLVCALMLGKRRDMGPPHNMVLTFIGAGLLWVGWFGFNAGSAVTANYQAGMAMTVTQIATAVAALTWMFVEWAHRGKPTVVGICSGAVAGLVAITPASGYVDAIGATVIGVACGVGCYLGATSLKHMFGYDDALDCFGVHGVGGIIGALLTGVFAVNALGGTPGAWEGNGAQFINQCIGVGIVVIYDAIATAIILAIIKAVIGLKVSDEIEREGLDLALHGEVVQ
jgi:Amt family ammonium transporter